MLALGCTAKAAAAATGKMSLSHWRNSSSAQLLLGEPIRARLSRRVVDDDGGAIPSRGIGADGTYRVLPAAYCSLRSFDVLPHEHPVTSPTCGSTCGVETVLALSYIGPDCAF